ncbi:MAG: hypothetical protein LQ346_002505 [Caloplaca aetnensis]|nr:MAG: hypothetical protein LQ346_002505 [Caloplaca aetnensis]
MPPQAASLRPQTTRQARRAYQKAGGAPRLSAVELRRLERSAELQERAARIKAHNDRARENKRKKAEKLEKEREARKRMGIPEPTKFKIGSSQLCLGAFVGAGIKRKREEVERAGISLENCAKIEYPATDTVELKQQEGTQRHSERLPKDAPPGKIVAGPINISRKELKNTTFATAASLMPPPLPRPPLRDLSANLMAQTTPQCRRDGFTNKHETDWDSLFDSNTQIAREISNVKEPTLASTTLKKPTVGTPVNSSCAAPAEFLSDICTQDLEYSSPAPSITKDCSIAGSIPSTASEEEGEEALEQLKGRIEEDEEARVRFLHPWEEPAFPFKKQRPDSELFERELEWISMVLGEMYETLQIGRNDVKTLIAGRRLPCPGEGIPPWLVAQMASKLEENRQNGVRLWSVRKLHFWAERLQEIVTRDVEERRASAVAAVEAKAKKERLATGSPVMNSRIDFAKGKTITGPLKTCIPGPKAALEREEFKESKPIDEFDAFELSSQDLRELDI